MAATVSLGKPASRAATARSRRASRTSSVRERVSGKVIAMTAPRGKGPGSTRQDTTAPRPYPRADADLLSCRGNTVAAMKKRAKPDIRERFGFAIKIRREELELTQEDLAEKAGIH